MRVGSNFLGQTGSGQILNNLIDNYQKNGVTIDGTGTTSLVANNTIIGDTVDPNGVNPIIARNGVQFRRNATGQVRNNAISKNQYGGSGPPPAGESPDDNDGAGLLAYSLPGSVQLNNNTLSLNDLGFDLATSSDLVVNNNVATNNRFSGLRAESDSTGNNIYNNQASGTPSPAGHDCRDDSTGSGTAGTGNTWTSDKGRTSMPTGICKP